MERKNVKDTLEELIKALCLDYWRRDKIISSMCAERRVDNELRYLNFKIFDAVAEVVGEERASKFIEEIGSSVGYAKSGIEGISEGTYKRYKWLVKKNIARRLYLH